MATAAVTLCRNPSACIPTDSAGAQTPGDAHHCSAAEARAHTPCVAERTAWAGTQEPKFACFLLLLSRRAATSRKKWLLPPSILHLISHPMPPVGHGQDFCISSQARESGKYRLLPFNPLRFKEIGMGQRANSHITRTAPMITLFFSYNLSHVGNQLCSFIPRTPLKASCCVQHTFWKVLYNLYNNIGEKISKLGTNCDCSHKLGGKINVNTFIEVLSWSHSRFQPCLFPHAQGRSSSLWFLQPHVSSSPGYYIPYSASLPHNSLLPPGRLQISLHLTESSSFLCFLTLTHQSTFKNKISIYPRNEFCQLF